MSLRRRLADALLPRRNCPLCGWRGFEFQPVGHSITRRKARCPICQSVDRHRAAFLLLRNRISPEQKVLHFAPERALIPWLVSLSAEYVTADLYQPAMRKIDITNVALPDASQTLVWCSHVLDLIADDKRALSELFRVLAPGGLLVLQVTIGGEITDEDPSVTSKEGRLKRFLHEDHVRLYGLDLRQRITDHGFTCEVLSSASLPRPEQTLYSLKSPYFSYLFLARKQDLPQSRN